MAEAKPFTDEEIVALRGLRVNKLAESAVWGTEISLARFLDTIAADRKRIEILETENDMIGHWSKKVGLLEGVLEEVTAERDTLQSWLERMRNALGKIATPDEGEEYRNGLECQNIAAQVLTEPERKQEGE